MGFKSSIRYLRVIGALLKSNFFKQRLPIITILGVTNRCNLSCWYCYGEHPYRSRCCDFGTGELLEIVRVMRQLGTQLLQLQGGEPLLREDLDIVIDEAHRFGMACDMVTNGTLVLKKTDIVRRLDRICISLDGRPGLNDANRGEGAYGRALEGVEFACSCGLAVRLSAVLTDKTAAEDIDWLIGLARRYKITVNFSPPFYFRPQFSKNEMTPHLMADVKLKSLLQHIIYRKREKAPIQFSLASYGLALNWPFTYKKRTATQQELPAGTGYPKCYHGDRVVFIDSDGSVYPCCNFWGRAYGNIRNDGIKAAVGNISRDNCRACYIPAYIDRNLIFGINFNACGNYVKYIIRGQI
ncbi:MAG: radical SAM protein [Patescibacteria group bacterium]